MLWIGVVLTVQGLGSFVSEKLWDVKFGLLPAHTPAWASVLVGLAGLLALAAVGVRALRSAHH